MSLGDGEESEQFSNVSSSEVNMPAVTATKPKARVNHMVHISFSRNSSGHDEGRRSREHMTVTQMQLKIQLKRTSTRLQRVYLSCELIGRVRHRHRDPHEVPHQDSGVQGLWASPLLPVPPQRGEVQDSQSHRS